MASEVEETLKRIEGQRGVVGTVVCNADGIPIRSSLDGVATAQYARLLRKLTVMAKSAVRDIDPQNDLTFLRLRSQKCEIMVGLENEFLVIVIQNLHQ
ncbi:dynein light chain roadblock-type 2-like [Myripristis murdjan]|nr:dynein light chain roadblock-type 2 [Myripristis murdjan]